MAAKKKTTTPKKKGRPDSYTKKIGDDICRRLSAGESLRRICLDDKLPEARTVHYWLVDGNHEAFFQQYTRARTIQAENMFDEILDIADDGENDYMLITKGDNEYNVEDREVLNRSRLRVDSRKWYLSKVLPKKFGDKIDLTTDGKALPAPIYGGESLKQEEDNDNSE